MLSAWILAGGRSSRFGSDKVLHPVDGLPLALRIAAVLSAAGLRPGLVTKVPRGLGLPERIEAATTFHPLHGVAAALAGADALVTPVDLVGLEVAQVRRLVDAFHAAPSGVYARGQPLLAVLPARWSDRARAFAEAGRPVHAFVDGLAEVDLGELENLNVPR